MKTQVLLAVISATAAAQPIKPQPKFRPPAKLKVTWLLGPLIPDPKDPMNLLQPVTLLVGSERVVLKPEFGALQPNYQSACAEDRDIAAYGLETGEVSKLTSTEGGAGGYLVRRSSKGRFEVVAWDQPHVCTDKGTGENVACSVFKKRIRLLATTATTEVKQKLIRVDKAGKQTAFDCLADD